MAKLTMSKIRFEGSASDDFANWGELNSLLTRVSKASPYLSGLIGKEGEWLQERMDLPVDEVISGIKSAIDTSDFNILSRSLRVSKARMALYLALLDIGEVLEVMEITRLLTEFADFTIETSLRYLIQSEIERGKLPTQAGEKNCGLFALAMGKQGAYELNYSSDIDLIIFFDESRFEGEDIYDIRKAFIRVVQRMVKLLSEQTGEGYVFRTDLRLRPDPSVTPVVIGSDQAESYYEALGRTWERAAMIKARPCAGDLAAGEAFLARLRPFIWRRYLDFAAIEDAHNMRLRIREHKNLDKPIALEGHHLKLGYGGIREIEFFTQTRQLIFGGRNEDLRQRGTLAGLDGLAENKVIEKDLAEYLKGEYLWLRRLEHATQMIEDQQTHIVPESEEQLARFMALLKVEDEKTFRRDFIARITKLHQTMEDFFAGTLKEESDESETISEAVAAEMVEGWMSLPALRSERSRVIFSRLKPLFFKKISESAQPEEALRAFDRFIRGLPSGVQLFSLFEANPALLDLLAEICAIAPSEARYLGENHRVFEAVISGEFYEPIKGDKADQKRLDAQMADEIKGAEDYEDRLNAVRRFVREAQFRVSVHLLRNLCSAQMAGFAYSQIADTALKMLHGAVESEIERRYGKMSGRGAAVLAMGKLGSREMTRSSDLDLVIIYDADGAEISDGKRGLAATTYYARFTQNFIQALTVATSEGALYEVDMRLRPSGRQGPVAVSLKAFKDYQMNEAWTWEHMALLRARVVAGDDGLADDIKDAASAALRADRDKAKIRQDVYDMRAKIRENFKAKNPFSLKYGNGRMMESELLLQGMGLLHDISDIGNSSADLLAKTYDHFTQKEHQSIFDAMNLYHNLSQLARLSFAGDLPDQLPSGWLARQSASTALKDEDALAGKLDLISQDMLALFDKYFER